MEIQISQKKEERKIVRDTIIVVEYDFSTGRNRRWAQRMNAKLTRKNFSLSEFEPGRATYIKRREFDLSDEH